MALGAKRTGLTLNEHEMSEVRMMMNAASRPKMQAFLEKEFATGSNTINLNDPQLGTIIRLMATGPGALKDVLRKGFKRALTDLFNKE